MSRPSRPTARALRLLAAALVSLTLTLLGGPALAHVRVTSTDAVQGGFGVLTFRVPTESDTASTTKVQIALPTDQPLAFVSVQPHPGWTVSVDRTKLATPLQTEFGEVTEVVSRVTWTASGGAIAPGQFDQFDIFAGPLPKTDSVEFKALQTYSDGEVARWIEPTTAGADEPEHPAPVLTLPAASPATGAASTAATASPSVSATAASAPAADDGDSPLPTVLSVLALVVALGAAGLALSGRRRGSRSD